MKRHRIKLAISLILTFSIIFSMPITAIASESEEIAVAEEAAAGRSTTYTARIMQGNTNEEDDCRAIENGLLNSGGYTTTSIVETGFMLIQQHLQSTMYGQMQPTSCIRNFMILRTFPVMVLQQTAPD